MARWLHEARAMLERGHTARTIALALGVTLSAAEKAVRIIERS